MSKLRKNSVKMNLSIFLSYSLLFEYLIGKQLFIDTNIYKFEK